MLQATRSQAILTPITEAAIFLTLSMRFGSVGARELGTHLGSLTG